MLQFPLYSGYKRLLEALSYDHSLELFSCICAKLISLYGYCMFAAILHFQ